MYEDADTDDTLDPTGMQDHRCTAIIEEIVALTPESEWDEAQ